MTDEVQPYPEWRAAAELFEKSRFQPGDLIPHEWFYSAFSMLDPDKEPMASKYKKLKLKYLSGIEAFKTWLREDQDLCLASEFGAGYRIVTPQEQTAWAQAEYLDDQRKELKRLGQRLTCIRLDELTDEQRRENLDAIAQLSRLRAMLPRSRQRLVTKEN